jgi:hypothetical protein
MIPADSVPTPNDAPNPDALPQQSTAKTRQIRIKAAGPRYFIGGSDAPVIMGADEAALLRLWREKRGEVEPDDLSGNLVVQLGVATEELIGAGTRLILGRCLPISSAGCGTRRCDGWRPHSTAGSKRPGPYSRPSSCCRGRSRKKRRPRNTCRSCNIICGWSRPDRRSCR